MTENLAQNSNEQSKQISDASIDQPTQDINNLNCIVIPMKIPEREMTILPIEAIGEIYVKSLKDGEKQMTCNEANETSLITNCRHLVGVKSGILKQQFKALRETQNVMLDHINDD
ncbi:unnamed protein product [Brachionus calyciflorus]|uniref:Uncharacterized protein n=1 Tax=Brachionus calyciflorus TaxID=104777 RepID=A0A813SPK4_9BILA|nr:unnamed protein product [Brachionus calyciflorus]